MNTWFTSDTHFGHHNIIAHGERPFTDVEEMEAVLVERWNAVVKPNDRIYHLGDVSWSEEALQRIMPRLNGNKRLILGNHDDGKSGMLRAHFQRISLWRIFKDEGFTCSHVPLMRESFRHGGVLNVHGHIHQMPDPSPHHWNISVERTDYRPVHLDEIAAVIAARGLREVTDEVAA